MASITQPRAGTTPALPSLSWIALVTVWIVWGSTFLGIRVAVQTIPPLLMAGSRFLIAGSVLALVLGLTQRKRLEPLRAADFTSILVTGVLLVGLGNGTLSYAEVQLPSGLAALIVAGVPIWMWLIDALLSRKMNGGALAGMAVGTIGMAALVGMPAAHVPLGAAFAVMAGSVCWAAGSVYARRAHGNRTHPLFPALEMIAGGAVLSIAGLSIGEVHALHPQSVTAASLGGFVWLVVMGSMVAYTAYGYAVRTLPTNVTSTYAYVNPIVAVALGALILKEALTPNVLAGGAAIIAAVVIILFANRRKEV